MKALRARRASASVEFALLATFVLVPMILGCADFIVYLTARAQLNTALQSLYYFAMTNPSNATSTADAGALLTAINARALYKVTLISATAENGCVSSTTGVAFQITSCPNGVQQNSAVQYKVQTVFSVPINLVFGLSNPVTLQQSGQILE